MAKGQKRSNREIKKPQAKKTVPGSVPAALPARGVLSPSSVPKKKG